uniref:Uncharacterized protein n=1 Tax=Anguilla anguilla TaxID=7936 RepID=A0A0E9UNJ4_ANGAN
MLALRNHTFLGTVKAVVKSRECLFHDFSVAM